MANKVVINNCFGGFVLSPAAVARLAEVGVEASEFSPGCSRHDPRLVRVVEEMGEAASGDCSELIIEVIAEDQYIIQAYDGAESVVTPSMMLWIKV